MIQVPHVELTGMLADAALFACEDKDLTTYYGVRLSWDGSRINAQATDLTAAAWVQWDPTDSPDTDQQETLDTNWGGADDPWALTIPMADVKAIISGFKRPASRGWTPLHLDFDGRYLKLSRTRGPGSTAMSMETEAILDGMSDLRDHFEKLAESRETREIALSARYLGKLGAVRMRGPVSFAFYGAERSPLITVGDRFSAAIQPVRPGDGPAQ
jgi:hypothetical protein